MGKPDSRPSATRLTKGQHFPLQKVGHGGLGVRAGGAKGAGCRGDMQAAWPGNTALEDLGES